MHLNKQVMREETTLLPLINLLLRNMSFFLDMYDFFGT